MCNFVAVIYGRLWYPIVCILAELMVLSVFLYWCLLAEMKVLSAFLNRDCTISVCKQGLQFSLCHTLCPGSYTEGHSSYTWAYTKEHSSYTWAYTEATPLNHIVHGGDEGPISKSAVFFFGVILRITLLIILGGDEGPTSKSALGM